MTNKKKIWELDELQEFKNEFESLDNPDICDIVSENMAEQLGKELAEKWENWEFDECDPHNENDPTPEEIEEITRIIFSACYSCAEILGNSEAEATNGRVAMEFCEWREELEEFAKKWDD